MPRLDVSAKCICHIHQRGMAAVHLPRSHITQHLFLKSVFYPYVSWIFLLSWMNPHSFIYSRFSGPPEMPAHLQLWDLWRSDRFEPSSPPCWCGARCSWAARVRKCPEKVPRHWHRMPQLLHPLHLTSRFINENYTRTIKHHPFFNSRWCWL